eukprot:2628873-Rhodomonas_salina.1
MVMLGNARYRGTRVARRCEVPRKGVCGTRRKRAEIGSVLVCVGPRVLRSRDEREQSFRAPPSQRRNPRGAPQARAPPLRTIYPLFF